MMVRCLLALAHAILIAGLVHAADPRVPDKTEFFEKTIRPLLLEKCVQCHGPEKQKASLRLDSRDAALKGSENGPVIMPGEPDKSPMMKVVRHEGELQMPPKEKLPDQAITALAEWIRMGVPWPENAPLTTSADAWKTHWAFRPVVEPPLPKVKNEAWNSSPVDRFILAKLESACGGQPAPPADRRTLIRRATFDLIGMPPTSEEVDAFVNDASPEAYGRLVDRLLASPRYGERWGRYWLDVARYANERGYVGVDVDRVYPFAYAYRDWVINAFNEDLPYDLFLMLQIAADQMVNDDKYEAVHDKRHLAAMGFLTVGRRFINNPHDIIDDRIDVTMRGMQGLTVTCARCHDHKFDPIPIKDYYSLYGVFASSREPEDMPLLGMGTSGPDFEAFQKELQKLEDEKAKFEKENEAMKKDRPREYVEKIKPFNNRIRQLHAKHQGAPPRGMVLEDLPKPVEPHVFLRGNPANRGPAVPRQFVGMLSGEKREPFHKGSGRLELAQAIASPDNPLTARVMANRIWLNHFGAGLVRTPSDFGMRSDPPSHPELLDYLASQFVKEGWSVKKFHRLIMLSSTYQQGADGASDVAAKDPANLYLSHANRRRLDFEALRDSLLFVTGEVDLRMGHQAIDLLKQPFSRRRTIYGFIDRQNLPGTYRTFDFASPDTHSPQRYQTTVPQQALFLMNSPFILEQSKKLIARPDVQAATTPAARIEKLYRLLFGRAATVEEMAVGMDFVGHAIEPGAKLTAWEELAQALLASNEFAYAD